MGRTLSDRVNRSVAQRRHVQAAVGTAENVGDDAEVPAGYEAFALAFVELVVVVVDPVPQLRIAEREVFTIVIELELEQVPALEERSRGAHEQIAAVLCAERSICEADRRRRHGPSPAELRTAEVRAGKDEQSMPRLAGRVGDERRWPAHLLQGRDECGWIDRTEGDVPCDRQVALKRSEPGFDLLELADAVQR